MPNPLYDALFAPLAVRSTPLLLLADGTSLSGAAVLRLIARYAHALHHLGLRPGDRVAVQLTKSPHALALYGAAVATGVIFLPLNPAYTRDEICYFTDNSGAALLLTDPGSPAEHSNHLTLGPDGSGSFAEFAAGQPDQFNPVGRAPDDIAALLYTSGTTGRAKGAMLTHANLLSNAQSLAVLWKFTANDTLLHALPIFHTHGLFVACNTVLLTGGAMLFLPGFDPDQIFALLPQATAMMGVPTFYTRLLADPRLTRAATAHIRVFISGSAPLLAETHANFHSRTGHAVLERYGMTETNMITSNPYDGPRRAGTVGFPLPDVKISITDPATGAALPQGDTGMIEVCGPNVFAGYWEMPDKTREDLRNTGFFITGDLGTIDDHGYLTIVGRLKDLIITGGYNVYPKELELLLDDQPGVLESAVIGVPHPDFGEAVLGFLVARPGVTLDPAAIAAMIRDRVARFKQPKDLIVVADLPRNAMGKVQKNLLRAAYNDRFKPF